MDLESRRSSADVVVLSAFALLSVVFLGLYPPTGPPNELSRFEAIYAFVETGSFRIDEAIARFGDLEDKSSANGHFYSNKAPGLIFAAIPFYRAFRTVLPRPRVNWDPVFILTRIATVTVVSVLAAAAFLRRMRERPEGPLLAVALLFATPYLFYARSFFSHAWTAALLWLAWDLCRAGKTRRAEDLRYAAGGFLAGLAAISEYNAAPLALIVAARAATRGSWRGLCLLAAGASLPIVLLLLYNNACFGSPWILSSAREARPEFAALAGHGLFGFGAPSPKIAWAFLFHPGRGLLWRSPFWIWLVPGFAAWWRSGKDRSDCVLCLVAVAGYFVLLTGYENWHGGWAIGNRYLLPVLVFAGTALAYALESPASRALFAAAVVFSCVPHLLLSLSWPYFPEDFSWPAVHGSLWFVSHGWISPAVIPEGVALLLAIAACAAAVFVSLRRARLSPSRRAFAAIAGVALFAASLAVTPGPSYPARLFRSAMYGVFSGNDPDREELRRVVLSASTESEKRQAASSWAIYSPRR